MKVGVVGSGPAGLFCAYTLVGRGAEVTVFDRGGPLALRECPHIDCTTCPHRLCCSILCGEGGSGGYSDGKITISTGRGVQRGSELDFGRFEPELNDVAAICEDLAVDPIVHSKSIERPDILQGSPFEFESYPLLHLGTAGIRKFMHKLRLRTEGMGAKFWYNSPVAGLDLTQRKPGLAYNANGPETSYFDSLILACGSYESDFMRRQATSMHIELDEGGPAGIGIRLETPEAVLEPLMKQFYDFKLYLKHPFKGQPVEFRSFCVNRNGSLVNECRPWEGDGLVSLNGCSSDDPTGRSNLAILAKLPDAKFLVRYLAREVNRHGKGLPIYQSAASFVSDSFHRSVGAEQGERIRNAVPGNLVELWPSDLVAGFQKYLRTLDYVLPGVVLNPESVVYAPEIKYHMPRWPLDDGFTVKGWPNIQVIGNAAGYTDSFSTAAVMGLVAARHRLSLQ